MNLQKGMIAVDATLGEGGHGLEIMNKIGEEGVFIGIDVDPEAVRGFWKQVEILNKKPRVFLENRNFSELDEILQKHGIEKADAILADLGWRSEQIEDPAYGMSFQREAKLDMRLGKKGSLTAKEIVNEWSKEELVDIFKKYGEERHAKIAVESIEKAREKGEIQTTIQLAEIIKKSLGKFYRKSRIHPATKIFQALRIAVNDELADLEIFLQKSVDLLNPGGRLAIISFHSLEDRRVKKFFRVNAGGCICPKEFPVCVCGKEPRLKIITRKPIISGEEELNQNPRARSAKLRIVERV
jgi:16S rRNA (cytosine1402-N4)-methyltransferase